jgi:hypothetical protein
MLRSRYLFQSHSHKKRQSEKDQHAGINSRIYVNAVVKRKCSFDSQPDNGPHSSALMSSVSRFRNAWRPAKKKVAHRPISVAPYTPLPHGISDPCGTMGRIPRPKKTKMTPQRMPMTDTMLSHNLRRWIFMGSLYQNPDSLTRIFWPTTILRTRRHRPSTTSPMSPYSPNLYKLGSNWIVKSPRESPSPQRAPDPFSLMTQYLPWNR